MQTEEQITKAAEETVETVRDFSENERTVSTKAEPVEVKAGAMVAKTATELGAILTQIHTGGGFPTRFDTKEKRLSAYNLAQSLMGSQWQLALNNIATIQGQTCIYGEFPGTLAERTGEVEERHTFLIDDKYLKICVENKNINAKPFASVTRIKRKGRALKEFTYSLEEAEKAGQYPPTKWDHKNRCKVPNPDSPWEKFFKVMLMRKSQAIAVKFEFPEAFVGVPIAEYDYDVAPDLKDVTPMNENRANELNEKFKTKTEETVNGSAGT